MGTATPDYWLTWRFLILGSALLVFAGLALIIIWKFEGLPRSRKRERDSKKEKVGDLYKDEAWTTCHKAIHPGWLLTYRLLVFILLLFTLAADVYWNSTDIFFFYTQWTFSLVTLYFGLGSYLSIRGCIQYRKGVASAKVCCIDEEKNDPPTLVKNASLPGVSKGFSSDDETDIREPAGYLGYAFQIMFQVAGGAVVLTDSMYWLILYPFVVDGNTIEFLPLVMHSMNAVALFGDVILNSLRFPFFRIAYFVIYSCSFVSFQWLVHMFISTWWPYPFLDISLKLALLMYLGAGATHIPCFGVFALVIALKRWLPRLFKWMIRKQSEDKQLVQMPSNK